MRKTALVMLVLVACGSSSERREGFEGANETEGTFGANGLDGPLASCEEAKAKRSSVGCDYWAVHMDGTFAAANGCFVAFVANAQPVGVRLKASFAGEELDLAEHARIPRGSGKSIRYDAFDPSIGIPPGEVAILFLAGMPEPGKSTGTTSPNWREPVRCPVAPARSSLTQAHGTGRITAFHIETSEPVVAYQMLPYGGGSAAVTGATLLLPTSAYGTNYLAVNAYSAGALEGNGQTSMDIVAAEDDTHVTILPKKAIVAGPAVPAAAAGEAVTYTLRRGEVLQVTQTEELTGSPIESDKPIGLFAGQPCMNVPNGAPYCDHGEQQIPPVSALGHEYVGAVHRQRSKTPERPPWRIVGAAPGTRLTYDPPGIGPAKVEQGQVAEFTVPGTTPFVVKSQDKEHPFLLLSYMTGSTTVEDGYGDADFVRSVSVFQYMNRYVFFTDPTYPETNLVVVRRRGAEGFADVELDCRGRVDGWSPVGDAYEITRIDLVRHDFQKQGGCDNGRHEMRSKEPFGLWVWGWGTTETTLFTRDVSYGYPAGENVAKLSDVVVPAGPR
jgi:hypothetical protein